MYKLNYPIETPEAIKFWGSAHKCNRMRAIMAFSLDLDNANDNYRRAGYTRAWRAKALAAFKNDVNKPDMAGIKFSTMNDLYWEEMPYNPPVFKSEEEMIEWAKEV